MPQVTTVVESYWCPGGWPWQWFRRCERTVQRWCYDFQWVREQRWFFFCTLEGCENGVKFTWSAGCFNLLGSHTYFNIRLCFDSPRQEAGRCS